MGAYSEKDDSDDQKEKTKGLLSPPWKRLLMTFLYFGSALLAGFILVFPPQQATGASAGTLPAMARLVAQLWLVTLSVCACHARLGPCLGKMANATVGGVVSSRRTAKTTRLGAGPWFSFVSSEMQGWRDAMEDAVVCAPTLAGLREESALFCVFDGHGGKEVSAFVADKITDRVVERLEKQPEAPADGLRQCLLDIEDDLRKNNPPMRTARSDGKPLGSAAGAERGRYDHMGCTASVALLTRTSVSVANVGDSRVFKCRRGECVPLTRDHKPESPRERRRIEAAGGVVVKMGPCYRVDCNLNMSRAMGDFVYKNPNLAPEDQKVSPYPDTTTIEIDKDDEFLVVACDGLFELKTWDTVCQYIHQRIKRMPLEQIAEGLLDECCSPDMYSTFGRGTDNESVIIVKFNS